MDIGVVTRPAIFLLLLLASCGGGAPEDSTVRRYEDVAGRPVSDPDSLGLTYYIVNGDAKHSADGWNHMVNEVLFYDDAPLRMRNVVVHELGRRFEMKYGTPENITPDWFTWDGDTKGDAPMVPDEAAWFAQFGPYPVHVSDTWLEDATDDAIDFIDGAAGVTVLERR